MCQVGLVQSPGGFAPLVQFRLAGPGHVSGNQWLPAMDKGFKIGEKLSYQYDAVC